MEHSGVLPRAGDFLFYTVSQALRAEWANRKSGDFRLRERALTKDFDKKNGDLEKNPLWQGFSSGLLSSVVPEDLEFRAQVCSPWMQDGRSLVLGQTNCLSSPNNLLSYG